MKTIFISYHISILLLLLLLIIIPSLLSIHAFTDTINTSQTITDGGDTLVSSAGNFELGFFSPGYSSNRYVGIWYKRSPSTVVWVANRETPITNMTMRAGHVAFKVAEPGNLVLFLTETNDIIWSTNNTSTATRTPVAQLLDSGTLGNLIIRDANDDRPQNFIWQSLDGCDTYHKCGAYGICGRNNAPMCGCLDKFTPSDVHGWDGGYWSSGCVRWTALSCEGDVFLRYSGIKLPDPQKNSWFDSGIKKLEECEARCLRNCSCVAFTRLDKTEGGSGCLLYYGELFGIKSLPESGQDLYVRTDSYLKTASSELEHEADSMGPKRAMHKRVMLIASFTSVVGVVLLCLSLFLCIQKRKKGQNITKEGMLSKGSHGKDLELPFFKISTVKVEG